jgi:hypothetical protein
MLATPTHLITLYPWWLPAFDAPLNKDVENRPWPLPPGFRGTTIAFHAGLKKFDVAEYEDMIIMIRRAGFVVNLTARRVLWWRGNQHGEISDCDIPRGAIVGAALTSATEPYDYKSRWAVPGAFPWRIVRWVRVPPIPCRGGRGLQPIPEDVRARLSTALATAASTEGREG